MRISRRGHSLVELVMVLSIIAVVAGIAAPRFSSAERRHRLDAAAQRIVTDLQYVSRTARATAASHAVSFSTAGHSYTSSARPLDVGPDEPYTVRLNHPPYNAKLVSVDLAGEAEVIFNGHGIADRGGEIVVGVGDATRRVLLDAATGEVTIE